MVQIALLPVKMMKWIHILQVGSHGEMEQLHFLGLLTVFIIRVKFIMMVLGTVFYLCEKLQL